MTDQLFWSPGARCYRRLYDRRSDQFYVSIRAVVRKDDERAERLRVAGVEVVIGDLLGVDSVRSTVAAV